VPGIFTDEPNYLHDGYGKPEHCLDPIICPEIFRQGNTLLDPTFLTTTGTIPPHRWSRWNSQRHGLTTVISAQSFSLRAFCQADWRMVRKKPAAIDRSRVARRDDLIRQAPISGAVMRFYEYMQTPGDRPASPSTGGIFQCGQAMHLYGASVWKGKTLDGDLWLHWLGFSLCRTQSPWRLAICHGHQLSLPASGLVLNGRRSQDGTIRQSIFYPVPAWHPYYPVVEDYFGRLGAALSEG